MKEKGKEEEFNLGEYNAIKIALETIYDFKNKED